MLPFLNMVTLGILADTHIPDRARKLHPEIIPLLKKAQPDAIIHAGDISTPKVLRELEAVAPVHAVRGNRDIFMRHLPLTLNLKFEDIKIGITHGHGNLTRYIKEKFLYLRYGPKMFSYFEDLALSIFPNADVVIFGHSHVYAKKHIDGQLLFNPGSATIRNKYVPNATESIALMHIDGKIIETEQINLPTLPV
ncbi:MAG: metallophosphatase family protein [Chloroflexota bacterium]